jgi:hypothetical protein
MMVCTQCGFQNETGDAFCGSCGGFLEWVGESVTTAASARAGNGTVETSAPPTLVPSVPPPLSAGEEVATAPAVPPKPKPAFRGEQPMPSEPETAVPAPPGDAEGSPAAAVVDLRGEPERPEGPGGRKDGPDAERRRPEKHSSADVPSGTGAGPDAAPDAARPRAVSLAAPPPTAPGGTIQGRAQASPITASTSTTAPAVEPPAAAAPTARQPRSGPPTGPVARRPDEVKPVVAKARPVPSKPPPRREIRPGDLICSECREGNEPTRRFCRRCGASLVQAKEAVVPPPLPWWKRPFVRQPKVIAAGERPMRRGGSAPGGGMRSRLPQPRRAAAIVAALGLAVGFAGPWRGTVKSKASGIRQALVPHFEEVTPLSVKASSQRDDHPAELAFDRITNDYWAGTKPDGREKLTVNFDPPIRLGKVGFVVGALTKPENFTAQARPQRVSFRFFDKFNHKSHKDVTKDLEDVGEFRYYNVDAKNVSRLEIEILKVKPSLQRGPNATDTAIAEITFFKRT